ncbi:Hsp70 family protein [Rhodoferax sp.]|uniref:Hsp70 family protein n=1 Tax=Rhodoferax sp. TaxID=50421 RepID=UPI00262E6370|nr:Hsp70 family protein [Rhodoferax sp.]MDD2811423.1 Hsp70 family protein [Rhodoferax sp.]
MARTASPVLGIDFGTSNSAAACVDAQGQLHPIALEAPRNAMPTAVYFSSENAHVSFGSAAMQQYLADVQDGLGTGRLMRAIKSLLGSALIDEQTVVNGRSISFFEVVVMFLRELKRRAQAQLGTELHAAMLGRPVHFVDDNPERDALAQATLQRAAHAAGFEQVQFQLEPIAAAFDFERRLTQDTRVLVVDIGGGTSDFTLMQLHAHPSPQRPRGQDILATSGIHWGGTDFDRLLDLGCIMPLLGYGQRTPSGRELPNRIFYELSTWHLVHHASSRQKLAEARDLWRDYANPAMHQRLLQVLQQRLGHQLLALVEQAKIACSESQQRQAIHFANLYAADALATAQAELDPAVLPTLLHKPLSAITACALACVAQAGAQAPEVLYLTGGSSALQPLVAQLQHAFPAAQLVHGDRFGGVANGLAWAAANA